MPIKGDLYIISAPSGAGKTTLVQSLIKAMPNVQISISHTTRSSREAEQHGKDYFFISEAEFKNMSSQGKFLESAEVFGNFYGTSKQFVEETLEKQEDIILEIDWQGARLIRKKFINTVSIFIFPPSFEALSHRLQNRHRNNPDVIETRMKAAKQELIHYIEYDYLICNDNFDSALLDLQSIIAGNRMRLARQREVLAEVIYKLIT